METDTGDIFGLSAVSSLYEQLVYTNRNSLECQDSFAIVPQIIKMSTQSSCIQLLNKVLGR